MRAFYIQATQKSKCRQSILPMLLVRRINRIVEGAAQIQVFADLVNNPSQYSRYYPKSTSLYFRDRTIAALLRPSLRNPVNKQAEHVHSIADSVTAFST
jgi:hypothetical protein